MPKAVLVAHVLGLPANIEPIAQACEFHGVTLIEDAAEALAAGYAEGRFASRQVGSIGRLGCYSFNGNKIMTTGGGGMIATADPELARRARHLTTQARLPGPEYLHDEIGYNYRLTNLAAAVGVAQLEQLPGFVQKKRAIARRYDEALGSVPGITLPPRPSWARPTFWLYSVLFDPELAGADRREVMAALDGHGIQTRPVWMPAHMMPMYMETTHLGGQAGESIHGCGISLPSSVGLTHVDQLRVVEGIVEQVCSR